MMLAVVVFGVNSANADRRGYVWTYEYQTMPRGHAELEYYLTHKLPDSHKYSQKNTWEHQVELEYGLTDAGFRLLVPHRPGYAGTTLDVIDGATGEVRIELEGRVYDGSVRTQLEKMKQRIERGY